MTVTYTAPNRPIHYHYARAFQDAGCLKTFVSGFPRFSPRAPLPELGDKLIRRDAIQCLYLASLRWPLLPESVSDYLAWASKAWLDRHCLAPARESDVFLFYNGCGLQTCRKLQGCDVLRIVEVVNSHVLNQDEILREEHQIAGVPYEGIYHREIQTRLAEYEVADMILCPSEFVRRSFLARGFPAGKLLKNIFGFEQPGPRPCDSRETDTFRILYVGSLSVRKGLRYLIEAYRQLDHPNKELSLVGPVQRDTGLERLSLPDGVKFAGVLKGAELATAYASASVFVLPSVEEGLALVMAEALSYGLPVIATDHTGAEDLFQDGVEGFIVPVRDANSIAARLEQLAEAPEERQMMGEAARRRAEGLAGWEVSGKRLVRSLMSSHEAKGTAGGLKRTNA